MAYRTLELTLISANGLKQVTLSSKMEVYAISSIDGNPSSQQCSPADREGGTSPVWNTTYRFSIPTGDPSKHFVHVILKRHHDLGDLDIGEIRIPLTELLNCFAAGEGDRQFVRCKLQNLPYKLLDVTPSRTDEPVKALRDGEPVAGKDGGVVNLSYKFLDAAPLRDDEPVTVYPYTSGPRSRALRAPPYAQPYQPPAGYGYLPAGGAPPYAQPYLPPAGYGYPAPAPAGYGYPPVGNRYGETHSSWNMFGSGMELLGGAIGVGVLIGDILSDGHSHDGGHSHGWDGSGGGGGSYSHGGSHNHGWDGSGGGGGSYSHGGCHNHGWDGSGGGGGSYSDGGGHSHGWGGSGGGGGSSYSDGGGYNDGWDGFGGGGDSYNDG